MPVSADDFRELVADARKERSVQGRAGPLWRDGTDVNAYFHSSTVLGPRQLGVRGFLW